MADDLDRVGALLFERGIYATLAFYPGVPRHEVGFRLQLTAANTGDQVDELLVVLDELADRGHLRTSALRLTARPPAGSVTGGRDGG